MDVLQKMEQIQVPEIIRLFAKVNVERVMPAYEKQVEIIEEAIAKIKQIEKTVSKTDNERSGDGKAVNNG
jgi:hypothetical protein